MPQTKPQPLPRELPTALLVAKGDPEGDRLKRMLSIMGLAVEVAEPDDAAQTAFVTAPDLLVLAGDAARDGGLAVIEKLGEHHATAMTPVVLVGDGGRSANAGRAALRHGVVAIIDRSEGVEKVGRRVLTVARSLPSRRGHVSGALGEAELDELVALLTESRRTGILSVRESGGGVLTHLVVRGDRPVDEMIAELAARLRGIGATDRGPLRYDFVESSSASLAAMRFRAEEASGRQLAHRRVAIVEPNPERAAPIAEALRANGAKVVVIEDDEGLDEARALLPSVVIIDGKSLEGSASDLIREVQADALLCWASLLVIDHANVVQGTKVDVAALSAGVMAMLQPDLELRNRVQAGDVVEARLEVVGPARTLRALASAQNALHLTVRHPRVRVKLDLVDGRVHDIEAAVRRSAKPIEPTEALATLLQLPTARVSIERFDPKQTGVGQPLDDALAAATRARAAIRRSDPPPTAPSARAFQDPLPGAPGGSEVARLVDRLEGLLGVPEEEETAAEQYINVATDLEATFADEDDGPTEAHSPEVMEELLQRVDEDAETKKHPPKREPTMKLGSNAADFAPWADAGEFDDDPTRAEPIRSDELAPLVDELDELDELGEPTVMDIPAEMVPSDPRSLEHMLAIELPSTPEHEPTMQEESVPWHGQGKLPAPPAPSYVDPRAPAPERAADEAPARTRGVGLGVAAAVAIGAFVIGVGGAYLYVVSTGDDEPPEIASDPSPEASTEAAEDEPATRDSPEPAEDEPGEEPEATREDEPPEEEAPAQPEVEQPEVEQPEVEQPEAAIASSGVRTDPIEGLDEDFVLEALGIDVDRSPGPGRTRRAAALNRRGAAARRHQRWDRAENSYRGVLTLDPRNGPATVGLVHVYRARDDGRNAVLFAQRLARLRPEQASSFILLSDAFRVAGEDAAALAAATRALRLDRGSRAARRRVRDLSD